MRVGVDDGSVGGGGEAPRRAARVREEAELRREDDAIAAIFDRLADEFLVDVRAVDLRRVDQRDAEVQGAGDGTDGLGVVAAGTGEGG